MIFIRLDKLLSQLKYGSRSEIVKICRQGRVTVNELVVKDASLNVDPIQDVIVFDHATVVYHPRLVLMMNKKIGTVCANKDKLHKTVFDDLDVAYKRYNLKVAGRLDIDAEGLLILTDDGTLIHDIISPNKVVKKTYKVTTNKPIENIADLTQPMMLKDGMQELYQVKTPEIVSCRDNEAVIVIHEGKYHQVKNMFRHIGHDVVKLERVAIGGVLLDARLRPGEARPMTDEEIKRLT